VNSVMIMANSIIRRLGTCYKNALNEKLKTSFADHCQKTSCIIIGVMVRMLDLQGHEFDFRSDRY